MTDDRRNAVATQPSKMASMASSSPIDGSPMIMEEPMKGVRKAPTVVTSKVARRLGVFSTLVPGSRVCINLTILPLVAFGVKARFAEPEIGCHYIRSLRTLLFLSF